jgi:Tfp pilus assembly protein PilN
MSSIQLNLIPDVKAQYLKAERTRKTAIVVSVIIIAASAGLVLLMMSVSAGQKIALNSANKNIDKLAADIKNTQDIEKILTVQSQLNTLDKLHSEKPVASRLPDFLAKIVPSQVQLNKIDVDLEQNTMTISGTTPSYEANNKFVDTLKFTNY